MHNGYKYGSSSLKTFLVYRFHITGYTHGGMQMRKSYKNRIT